MVYPIGRRDDNHHDIAFMLLKAAVASLKLFNNYRKTSAISCPITMHDSLILSGIIMDAYPSIGDVISLLGVVVVVL